MILVFLLLQAASPSPYPPDFVYQTNASGVGAPKTLLTIEREGVNGQECLDAKPSPTPTPAPLPSSPPGRPRAMQQESFALIVPPQPCLEPRFIDIFSQSGKKMRIDRKGNGKLSGN